MNPSADQQPPLPPPQVLPLQLPRSSFSCDRHPDENFSGFCPLCLCDRLTTLDHSAGASSSSRRNSTSSSTAFKSLFKTSLLPELRRAKSFSASKNDALGSFAGVFELQRKSCDVRGRNTLWTLFSVDDENKALANTGTVLETNREEDDVEEEFHEEKLNELDESNVNDSENDIVEESAEIEPQLKTMQDHIDLDSHSKKQSRSNFWSAASTLGKKLQNWRRKQKNGTGACSSSTLPVEKPISRQYRETRSEIADYGFGRRSCDIDPRFSLDAGRISIDEPRASWDGYVVGRTFPRLPPMVEDLPVVPVPRSDKQIAVEQPANSGDLIPGNSIQTREYYTDSSSRRRKSLDRSNSIKKMAAAVVAEMDETKTSGSAVSNAKVSPATIDYNYGLRFPSIGGERELSRDSNSTSLRDDCSETFELGLRDTAGEDGKKRRRWRWKLWRFIHRFGSNKDNDEDVFSRVNGVGRSYSESWQETGINNRLFRSNSTVSWRNSSFNTKKSNSEMNGKNGKNRRIGGDDFDLERNRSAKYSPNHADSGLLRFYLTPLRGSRRNKSIGNANPISRNVHS